MIICAGKDSSYYVRCLVLLYPVLVISAVLGKSCHHANLSAKPIWTYVSSPRYPAQFPPQTQCWWRISAPPQFRIYLQFTAFDLVSPKNKHCEWQWLNVIEGSEDPEITPHMITLCGKSAPRVIISKGNVIRLNLHSNSAVVTDSYKGFRARYKYTTESAYSPPQEMSMAVYPDQSSNSPAVSPINNPPNGNARSLGSVLAPIIKTKPLPPNPNAVRTLQNRRTELQNKLRNNGIAVSNAAANTLPPRRKQAFGPRVPVRPVTERGNIIPQNQHPPSTRSKPLPNEIKILLAVMGTIGLIAILLFIAKKLFCDRRHKDKSGEGRIMHAYAHFRHFKKKRRKGDTIPSQINTLSRNVQEGSSTMQSSDSGLSTSHNTPKQIKKKTVQSENSSSDESSKVKLENVGDSNMRKSNVGLSCRPSDGQKHLAQQNIHDPQPSAIMLPARNKTHERSPTANETFPVQRTSAECTDGRRKRRHHHRANVQQENESNRCRRTTGERRNHGARTESGRQRQTTLGESAVTGHRRPNWREKTYH